MKKISIFIAICFIIITALTSYADFDYSLLDELTETELQELQNEITTRLENNAKEPADTEANKENAWEIQYYVDDFGDPTENGFLTNNGIFKGTFSNSATSKSDLLGFFLIDRTSAAVKLYEYGKYIVNNPYSSNQYYDITIKDQNDNKQYFKGVLVSNSDRIFIEDSKSLSSSISSKLLSILKKDGTITMRIDEEDSMTSYLFKVDCTGFNELYTECLNGVFE